MGIARGQRAVRMLNVLLAFLVSFFVAYVVVPLTYKLIPRTVNLVTAIVLAVTATALGSVILLKRRPGHEQHV